MKFCRLTINALAIAEGLLGAFLIFCEVMFFAMGEPGKISRVSGVSPHLVFLSCLFFGALISYLAIGTLRVSVRYLRVHDRKTATSVAAVFCFTLGFLLLAFFGQFFRPESNDALLAFSFLALEALLMGSAWLLYRFALRPIAANAFPTNLA